MGRQKLVLSLLLLALFGVSSAAHGQFRKEMVTIKGVVVDSGGNPVRGAMVDRNWLSRSGGRLEPDPNPAWTDATGRFEFTYPVDRFPEFLSVIDHVRGLGSLKMLTNPPEKGVFKMVAEPLAKIKIKLSFDGLEVDDVSMFFIKDGESTSATAWATDVRDVEILVPHGDYMLSLGGRQTNHVRRKVSLKPGETTALDDVEMKLTGLARSVGQQALPLSISDAIGVPKDFMLTDLKGKWVLMQFWAPGSGMSYYRELPEFKEFYNSHRDLHDQFEIIAFHKNTREISLEELKVLMAPLEKRHWGGKLPFPIVMDKDLETTRRYGVFPFTPTVLIDPEGYVVANGSLELLKEKLGIDGIDGWSGTRAPADSQRTGTIGEWHWLRS
jgi:hypothetical protein